MGDLRPDHAFALCVFCGSSAMYDRLNVALTRVLGSSSGSSEEYTKGARDLAEQIAFKSWSLIYGGGTLGLMGTLASSVVNLRGPDAVHGIIPRALLETGKMGYQVPEPRRFGHTTIVSSMHERKRLMLEHASAFVALPGGYGTMEELFEMITWNQLGIHDIPIVIFNINGFYDHVVEWVRKAVREGFVPQDLEGIIYEAKTAEEVIRCVENYKGATGRYTFLNWSEFGNVDKSVV